MLTSTYLISILLFLPSIIRFLVKKIDDEIPVLVSRNAGKYPMLEDMTLIVI
jgi:hypothetical protein